MRIIGLKKETKQILVSIISIFIFLFGIYCGIIKNSEIQSVYATSDDDKQQIILDAGHGGIDGGAVGINNVLEKKINLEITLKLAELLQKNNFDVILTRSNDDSIHNSSETDISKQKRSDMYNRKNIMNSHPNAIFISIHQNKFYDSSCKGAQIFYSKNCEESQVIAQILQNKFREKLQLDNKREIKAAEDNLFLLYNAEIPAVLVECGFLSNQEECQNLCDEEYQTKIAYVILEGLLEWQAETCYNSIS